jgi:hypothetical protein
MQEIAMKEQLESYAAWVATRIQNVGADFDPEVLSWPGGSLIATFLWVYARGTTALKFVARRHHPPVADSNESRLAHCGGRCR